jgi:hypothetical protein
MTDTRTAMFTKDKNNILSDKQCEIFIKNYKEYNKGETLNIINPKTNKPLNDKERIKYIYDKCKKKLGLDSKSPKSPESPEYPKSSSSDNEIILDSYNKVQDIIYIPLNSIGKNKALISSLFSKSISYEKGLMKLKDFLNNQHNLQNIYVNSYHRILIEINNIFARIYNNNTLSADVLTRSYDWEYNYNYNPFTINGVDLQPNIIDAIKNIKNKLRKMWKNTLYLNTRELRCVGLNKEPLNEIRKIVMYSQNNQNKEDMIRHLNDNIDRYIALQFILVLIRDGMINKDDGNINAIGINSHLDIIDALVTKNIVNILYNNKIDSVSVSRSISWTGTPRSSSSGHSHFQSKANIEKYRKTKMELIELIKENNINDTDPYLAEKWEDMPLSKLRNIIFLTYKEGRNTYSVAFYTRTLYQAWRNSVKNNTPFKNPYTRKNFTLNDKEDIMNAITFLYPDIKVPKGGEGRPDISFQIEGINYGIARLIFNYIYRKTPYQLGINIPLFVILIPMNFNVDVEPAYNQQYLFENIKHLNRNKKLFGKKVIIKPLDVLLEYNHKVLDDYNLYKDFFDKIKNAL